MILYLWSAMILYLWSAMILYLWNAMILYLWSAGSTAVGGLSDLADLIIRTVRVHNWRSDRYNITADKEKGFQIQILA
jgi:hypothetical protein